MKIRGSSFYLSWVSLFFISVAIILTVFTLVQYSRLRNDYPPEMVIAGVPVGGLDLKLLPKDCFRFTPCRWRSNMGTQSSSSTPT